MTAAHPALPFGTRVLVTNRHNNKKVILRINDRGPFTAARIIDVSRAAAEVLDMIVTGTAPVLVESLDQIIISQPNITPAVKPAAPAQNQAIVTPAVQPSAPVQPPEQIPPPAPVPPPLQAVPTTQVPPPAPVQSPAPVQPPAQVLSPEPIQPPAQVPSSEPVQPQVPLTPPVTQQPAPPIAETPPAPAYIQPAIPPIMLNVRLIPDITVVPNKNYSLQVGSYRIARNAVDAFEKLKCEGLIPKYERFVDPEKGEFFRVVIAGIRGTDVQSVVKKIGSAGFYEAIIREEH
jgi:rare lipoprotein A